MVVRGAGSMIVIRQNKETSSDRDWDEFLDLLVKSRPDFPKLKILVVTDGGGPSAYQRSRLEKALDGRSVRVAVVSDSVRTRFIVSSIALLNRGICSFNVREMAKAYDHLGFNAEECKIAERMVEQMSSLITSA